MPYALILFGLILIVSAYRNTTDQLGALLKSDFTGQNSFFVWIGAIILVGSIGYIKIMEGVSRAMLVLILLVLFLSNQGFFAQLSSALQNVQGGEGNPDPGTNEPPRPGVQNPQGVTPGQGIIPNLPGLMPGIIPPLGDMQS